MRPLDQVILVTDAANRRDAVTITRDLQGATHEERQGVARAAVEAAPETEQADVCKAAIRALTVDQRHIQR